MAPRIHFDFARRQLEFRRAEPNARFAKASDMAQPSARRKEERDTCSRKRAREKEVKAKEGLLEKEVKEKVGGSPGTFIIAKEEKEFQFLTIGPGRRSNSGLSRSPKLCRRHGCKLSHQDYIL